MRADEDQLTVFGSASAGLHLEVTSHGDPPGKLPSFRSAATDPAELVGGGLEALDLE